MIGRSSNNKEYRRQQQRQLVLPSQVKDQARVISSSHLQLNGWTDGLCGNLPLTWFSEGQRSGRVSLRRCIQVFCGDELKCRNRVWMGKVSRQNATVVDTTMGFA